MFFCICKLIQFNLHNELISTSYYLHFAEMKRCSESFTDILKDVKIVSERSDIQIQVWDANSPSWGKPGYPEKLSGNGVELQGILKP